MRRTLNGIWDEPIARRFIIHVCSSSHRAVALRASEEILLHVLHIAPTARKGKGKGKVKVIYSGLSKLVLKT